MTYFVLSYFVLMLASSATAFEFDRRLPDEYETVGGQGLALGNVGTANQTGVAAVRINPALIAADRSYAVNGGYIWPTLGREFYQLGVVDAKSSNVAAGFVYNGFAENYGEDEERFSRDSPVMRRAHLALAQNMGRLSVGIGAHFVEGQPLGDAFSSERIRGTAINFGIASTISSRIKLGLTAENFANRKIANFAPRTFKAGLAYLISNDFSVHLDLRQRDRISELEQSPGSTEILGLKLSDSEARQLERTDREYEKPERMAFASFSGRIYDMVRVLGAYGQSIDGPERQSLAGGVAIVSGNVSLCYAAARPYLDRQEAEQSINVSVAINM